MENETNAYEAGKDAAENGANTINCSFKFFSTPELRDAWQKGQDDYYKLNPSKKGL